MKTQIGLSMFKKRAFKRAHEQRVLMDPVIIPAAPGYEVLEYDENDTGPGRPHGAFARCPIVAWVVWEEKPKNGYCVYCACPVLISGSEHIDCSDIKLPDGRIVFEGGIIFQNEEEALASSFEGAQWRKENLTKACGHGEPTPAKTRHTDEGTENAQ